MREYDMMWLAYPVVSLGLYSYNRLRYIRDAIGSAPTTITALARIAASTKQRNKHKA